MAKLIGNAPNQISTNGDLGKMAFEDKVSVANINATGTKDATTFLRGDNTFQAVSSYTDADALTLFNASGSAPVYACRAWVNFNGQGTLVIRGSGNVSSVTDNGTGDYTINFTTAMPDVNYSFAASSSNNDQGTSDEYTAVSAYGTASYLAGSLRIGVLRLRFDVQQMYNTTINSVSIFR